MLDSTPVSVTSLTMSTTIVTHFVISNWYQPIQVQSKTTQV